MSKFNKGGNADMTKEAVKEAKRLYYENYRKNNPEKIKAANERYWSKKVAALIETKENTQEVMNVKD